MVVLFIKDVIRDNEFWKFICRFIYNFIKIGKYNILIEIHCMLKYKENKRLRKNQIGCQKSSHQIWILIWFFKLQFSSLRTLRLKKEHLKKTLGV